MSERTSVLTVNAYLSSIRPLCSVIKAVKTYFAPHVQHRSADRRGLCNTYRCLPGTEETLECNQSIGLGSGKDSSTEVIKYLTRNDTNKTLPVQEWSAISDSSYTQFPKINYV